MKNKTIINKHNDVYAWSGGAESYKCYSKNSERYDTYNNMNIISRIEDALAKVRKRGDVPTMIWLGQEEKYELERLFKDEPTREIKKDENRRNEICGLPYSFVSSPKWLTVSYTDDANHELE